MLIRVIYINRRYDMIKNFLLQDMIDAGIIWSFKRSSGWVVVGEDPVRREQRPFPGRDRRRHLHVAVPPAVSKMLRREL